MKFDQKVYDYFNYEIIQDEYYNYRIRCREDNYMMPNRFNSELEAKSYLDKILENLLTYTKFGNILNIT